MEKSRQKIVFLFLIAIFSITNALKIRNNNRCLRWNGELYPTIVNNGPTYISKCLCWYFFPDVGWVQKRSLNGSFQLCVEGTNMCLGIEFNIRNNKIEIEAVMVAKNDESSSQQWKIDGSKLTNVRMGPNSCAQAGENIIMVPCNANEPKQKFDIDNKEFILSECLQK